MKYVILILISVSSATSLFSQQEYTKISINDLKSTGVDSVLLIDDGSKIVTIPIDSFASIFDLNRNSVSDRNYADQNDDVGILTELDSVWLSEKSQYYKRAGSGSLLETGPSGSILRPSATGSAIPTTWAIWHAVQNTGATKAFEYGMISDGNTPRYAFLGVQNAGSNFNSVNALRIYDTYLAYGASRLYHQGFRPTLNEITSVAGGNFSLGNILLGATATSGIGLETGVFSALPSGRIMGAIGTANTSFTGEVNGNLILIPRSSLSSTSTSIYTGQNGLGLRVQGSGAILIPNLNGSGIENVSVDALGNLVRTPAVTGDNLGNGVATTNINLGANYISVDGTSNGISLNADNSIFGLSTSSTLGELTSTLGGSLRFIGTSAVTQFLAGTTQGMTFTPSANRVTMDVGSVVYQFGENGLQLPVQSGTPNLGGLFRESTRDRLMYNDGRIVDTVVVFNDLNSYTGWAQYTDTEFTSGSPFIITANNKVDLPNNAGNILDSQLPIDVDSLYNRTDSTIIGRNGDGIAWSIEFSAVPSVAADYVELSIDIGGAIGEIYPDLYTFPRGAGQIRNIIYKIPAAYTLGTWQANGGKVKIVSNGSCDIYNIRYVISRTHKGR